MLFSRLGLFYQLSDLAGYWGRWMLSLCLGLYYQLSDLAGYQWRWMLSPCLGLLIPARGAFCRIMREIYAVLLVWVYTTSFQTLLDVGGDEV